MKRLLLLLLLSTNCSASTWECINKNLMACNTWRMLVPTGWVVASDNSATTSEHGYAMVFVPDEQHIWKL